MGEPREETSERVGLVSLQEAEVALGQRKALILRQRAEHGPRRRLLDCLRHPAPMRLACHTVQNPAGDSHPAVEDLAATDPAGAHA